MSIFNIILAFHVLGGSMALVAGPIPMLARKGGILHRKAGTVFTVALRCGAVAAFILSLMVGNRMLLTIAVLTAFLIFSGLRAIRFRHGTRPDQRDDAACIALVCFGLWLLYSSLDPTDVTGIFFAAGSLILASRQWLRQHSSRPDWLLAHIAGMGGAYTATVTAFIVVNLRFLPEAVAFIVPSLIGTSLITWTSIRYAARPNLRRPPGKRQHLKNQILEGSASPLGALVNEEYFEELRGRVLDRETGC